MPNEITVLEGDGEETFAILFLFPVATPKQVAGANVVPTPSSGLSGMAAAILTAQEKASLDAGTLAFEVVSMARSPALTAGQLLTALRAECARRQTVFAAEYTERYRYAGNRYNAT